MNTHQFSLELLGPVKISILGQLVKSGIWAKSLALLAYIASENNVVHRREILAELLWPDKPRGAALTSLRQAISQLHKSIPSLDDYLHITTQTIQFRSEGWEGIDVARFHHLVDICDRHIHVVRSGCVQCIKQLEQAIELYHGQFMSGFFLTDLSSLKPG